MRSGSELQELQEGQSVRTGATTGHDKVRGVWRGGRGGGTVPGEESGLLLKTDHQRIFPSLPQFRIWVSLLEKHLHLYKKKKKKSISKDILCGVI